MKNNNKNMVKIRILLFLFMVGSAFIAHAQNQKAWTGTSKLFGINGTTNPGSVVTWTLGLGTSSTSSKLDSSVSSRNLFSRITCTNASASMIVDTVKVGETVGGCAGAITSKIMEVYPLPVCSLPTSQSLCNGASLASFNLYITNYAAISGIGNLTLTYQVRAGSSTGTALGGSSSGTLTGIASSSTTINPATWPAMTAGTTYYFVITSFGSTTTSGGHPAPGNIASVTSFPTTYTFIINPAVVAPTITAY